MKGWSFLPLPFALLMSALSTPALLQSAPLQASAQPNQQHGQKLYAQCAACHVGGGSMGPDLVGVVGRRAGSVAGYRYSPAMRAAGFDWTEAKLRAFLRDPRAVVPANKMPYGGLSSDRDADDLVAYLAGRH